MIVRCGRCRSEFDVAGPGRFACPVCGTVNEVRAAGEAPGDLARPAPSPPAPSTPAPRVDCPECDFNFIVGDIDTALCPNCGAEVPVAARRGKKDRKAAS